MSGRQPAGRADPDYGKCRTNNQRTGCSYQGQKLQIWISAAAWPCLVVECRGRDNCAAVTEGHHQAASWPRPGSYKCLQLSVNSWEGARPRVARSVSFRGILFQKSNQPLSIHPHVLLTHSRLHSGEKEDGNEHLLCPGCQALHVLYMEWSSTFSHAFVCKIFWVCTIPIHTNNKQKIHTPLN